MSTAVEPVRAAGPGSGTTESRRGLDRMVAELEHLDRLIVCATAEDGQLGMTTVRAVDHAHPRRRHRPRRLKQIGG